VNPLGIIYFTGGLREIILGLILAFIYIFIQFYKHNIGTWDHWKIIVYGIVTFIASYYIVQTAFSLLI
jgi:hypothetical protein